MGTVTISLETYNSMQNEIERLKKENEQKQIVVTPAWYYILASVSSFILGLGLIMQLTFRIH